MIALFRGESKVPATAGSVGGGPIGSPRYNVLAEPLPGDMP
jgi:hypothetical protein